MGKGPSGRLTPPSPSPCTTLLFWSGWGKNGLVGDGVRGDGDREKPGAGISSGEREEAEGRKGIGRFAGDDLELDELELAY